MSRPRGTVAVTAAAAIIIELEPFHSNWNQLSLTIHRDRHGDNDRSRQVGSADSDIGLILECGCPDDIRVGPGVLRYRAGTPSVLVGAPNLNGTAGVDFEPAFRVSSDLRVLS
jgi:hypothetical protein